MGRNNIKDTLVNPVTGVFSDTELGEMAKWFSWSEQDRRLKELTEKEREFREAKYRPEEIRFKQTEMANIMLFGAMQEDSNKEHANIKLAKARKYAGKIGVDIDSPGFRRQFDAWSTFMDKNTGGTEKQLKAYEKAVKSMGSLKKIRELNYSRHQIEREDAEFPAMLAKEYQKRVDYHQNVRMDAGVKQTVFTDSKRVALVKAGDYQGIARLYDAAADAARRGDKEALAATGFDKKTQDMFLKWAAESPDKLKQVTELGDLYRQFMGDCNGPTAGRGVIAARNAFAGLYRLNELKEVSTRFEEHAKIVGSRRDSRQANSTQSVQSIFNSVGGASWAGLPYDYSKLLDRYNRGEVSKAEVDIALKALREYMDTWMQSPRQKILPINAAMPTYYMIIDAFASTEQANLESMQYDYLMGQVHELQGEIYLPTQKLNGDDQGIGI
jgi:hypothetical protein